MEDPAYSTVEPVGVPEEFVSDQAHLYLLDLALLWWQGMHGGVPKIAQC
ncbi:hypothetical protein IWX64_000509 [Arthrobacter sp. CAN_A212]